MQNIWEGSGSKKLPIGEHQVLSQGLSVLLPANLGRNSSPRNNNSQPLCYWSYWSVLMTMVAVSGDRCALANAACSGLRASPDASGSGRRWRESVCVISPARLSWSLMLHVDQWPTKHYFQSTTYVEYQLLSFAMKQKRVTRMILAKNVQHSMWRPYDEKIL